jgi:hypothetical protein
MKTGAEENIWTQEGGSGGGLELHNLYISPHMIRVIEIKEDEFGGVCSTRGKYEKRIQNFGRNT